MAEVMTFPDSVEEFMESYKVVDTEHIYTNGTEFVPIFRMKQWFQHKPERKKGKWIEHNPHKWGLGIVFECSECGEKIDCDSSNYCPNCGAEMEGQDDSI